MSSNEGQMELEGQRDRQAFLVVEKAFPRSNQRRIPGKAWQQVSSVRARGLPC